MSKLELAAQLAALQAEYDAIEAEEKAEALEALAVLEAEVAARKEALGLHTTPVSAGGSNTARNFRLDGAAGVNFRTPASQTWAIYEVVLSYKMGEVFQVAAVVEAAEALWSKIKPAGKSHLVIHNSRVRDDFKNLVERKKIVACPTGGYTRLV